MEITNAKIVSSDKRNKINGGLYIEYESIDNVIKGDYVEMTYDNKIHYFRVTDVSINGELLNATATEAGYWTRYFARGENFDLRTIIGIELRAITDPEKKQEIKKMSCWC